MNKFRVLVRSNGAEGWDVYIHNTENKRLIGVGGREFHWLAGRRTDELKKAAHAYARRLRLTLNEST